MSDKTQTQVRRVRPGEWDEITQPPATMPNNDRFVPEIRRHRTDLPQPVTEEYALRAPQGATQHVELRTSMTDRAVGHLIMNVPMLGFVAILTPVLWRLAATAPLTAGFAITLWFITFALLWAGSWVLSLVMSAEGIGLISELLKWKMLFREQDNRWRHYERMNDYED